MGTNALHYRSLASSKSTPKPAGTTPKPTGRSSSVDAQSVQSVQTTNSTEGRGWIGTTFGGSFSTSNNSTASRLPLEMTTRHDKNQLPPTLSDQLNEPQDADWDAFLLKQVELRQQSHDGVGGGEVIGASQFGLEGSEGRKKHEHLTKLLVSGIPMRLRHPIWMELTNTHSMMKPGAYAYYLSLRESDDPAEIEAILKDVPRTLTEKYEFYTSKGGFQKLKDLLIAFVGRYPNLGYTQGLNTIAGYLLLAIPSQEDAFWVLCNVVENYFPEDYFSRKDAMTSSLADSVLLREYVKELIPDLHDHMNELDIPPKHTVPIKWLFTAFSNALPEAIVMRLWDVWLCSPAQKNILFAFALALLSHDMEGIMATDCDSSYYWYMDSNVKVPVDADGITTLIKLAYKIDKKLESVAKRRAEMKERVRLENRLMSRKTDSLEVLVDREEPLEEPSHD